MGPKGKFGCGSAAPVGRQASWVINLRGFMNTGFFLHRTVARLRSIRPKSARAAVAPDTVTLSKSQQIVTTAQLQRKFCARTEKGGAHYKYWYKLTDQLATNYAYSRGEAYNLLRVLAGHYDLGIDWADSI
jgi:hypothetical protein